MFTLFIANPEELWLRRKQDGDIIIIKTLFIQDTKPYQCNQTLLSTRVLYS